MLNLDPAKLLVIAVVAIILLGPDKLPQVARQVGGAWRSFNQFRHRMETEVRNTMPDLPPTSEIARLARSPSALLDHLSNMGSDDDEETPPSENGTAHEAEAEADAGVDRTHDEVERHEPSPPAPVVIPPSEVTSPRPATRPSPSEPRPDIVLPGDPTLN